MNIFQNLDLLSLGIVVAASLILGVVVFLNLPRNATGKLFLLFTFVSAGWGVVNYLSYTVIDVASRLWLIRLVVFFATFQALFFFLLMRTFPHEKLGVKMRTFWALLTIAGAVAALTLTPFVFSGLEGGGRVASPIPAPGVGVFALAAVGFVLFGIITMVQRTIRAQGETRVQFRYLLTGVTLMFLSIIIFDLIFPTIFRDTRFIPLGAVFILPFALFTAYAVLKHHLLGVKVIATEILTFVLAIVSLGEVIFSEEFPILIFRSGVFLLVLSFGIMLIRSVRKEVEQREHLQKLSEELARANDKLKQLDKQKNEFLSFASHDLKSPIALIKQFASLIFDGTYKEPEKVHETVLKIKNTADRAVNMVDTFLDLRKIEEGHMEYNFEKKNIVEFVAGIASDFTPLAKEKNIAVSFESSSKTILATIDTTTFRQVIQNFLDNSRKYTEKGWIKARVQDEQKSVLITISDSGLGMDKDLVPILFEQFRRDPGVAKKIQGTGLGLFIAKQIVLAHHGDTWAESEGKGKGSQFYIRIPKA